MQYTNYCSDGIQVWSLFIETPLKAAALAQIIMIIISSMIIILFIIIIIISSSSSNGPWRFICVHRDPLLKVAASQMHGACPDQLTSQIYEQQSFLRSVFPLGVVARFRIVVTEHIALEYRSTQMSPME